jgi:hypothetical protein
MKRTTFVVFFCMFTAIPASAQQLRLNSITFPQDPGGAGAEPTGKTKAIYAISLGAAAAGTIWNIKTTRDALDHHLEARTFPLVWKKTRDPNDKNKVSAIIGGVNGGLMAISAIAFAQRHHGLATLVNVLVAGATTAIALHNRSINNDSEGR